MHSRIYVLRQIEDGKKLPSMNDRSCVTEDELAESFVPTHGDYVSLVKPEEGWDDDVEWITSCYKELFTISVENGETFLTLDNKKGLAFLKEMYKRFQKAVSDVTEADFCSYYSLNMYRLQEVMNDERGFWIITVSDDSGWWYDTFDSFLRSHCGSKEIPDTTKFRVEDIFDYHF